MEGGEPVFSMLHNRHIGRRVQRDEPRPCCGRRVGVAFGFGCLGKHSQSTAGQASDLFRGSEEEGEGFGGIENVVGEGGGELRKLLRDGVEACFGFA